MYIMSVRAPVRMPPTGAALPAVQHWCDRGGPQETHVACMTARGRVSHGLFALPRHAPRLVASMAALASAFSFHTSPPSYTSFFQMGTVALSSSMAHAHACARRQAVSRPPQPRDSAQTP